MDPKLTAALQKLQTAMMNAKKAGQTLDPASIDAFLQEETGGKYTLADVSKIDLRNLGRSVAQGATFNFADELAGLTPETDGGAKGAIEGAFGPVGAASGLGPLGMLLGGLLGASGGGHKARDEMRARDKLFAQEHPVADAAGQLAGGTVASLAAPEVRAGGLLATGLQGALAGAASGAGAGETTDERASDGLTGGLMGGALGVALPSVVAGAKAAFSPAQRAARQFSHAVDESGGVQKLLDYLGEFTKAGRGNEVMAGDLSPRLRQATDFAVNANDDVLSQMAPKLEARQSGMGQRVLNDVNDRVGDPNAETRLDELARSRSAWAGSDAGFEGLRKGNPQLPAGDELVNLAQRLEQPRVRQMWKEAQDVGLIGSRPDLGKPSFQIVQDMKEKLDDASTAAFRKGHGNLGRNLADFRDQFVMPVLEKVPGYTDISAEYGRRIGLEKAVQTGVDLFHKEDTRLLEQYVQTLKPEALNEIRTGLASELVAKLRAKDTQRNVAAELVKSSPAMMDKLKLVFGSKETFDSFMHAAKLEREMARMGMTVGGSQTARRTMAQGFDPAEMMIAGAHGGPAGVGAMVTHAAAKSSSHALSRNTAGKLGPLVMTQGDEAIRQLLQNGKFGPALIGPTAARAPVALSSLLDYFNNNNR